MTNRHTTHVLTVCVAGVELGNISSHWDACDKREYWRAYDNANQECDLANISAHGGKYYSMVNAYKVVIMHWQKMLNNC